MANKRVGLANFAEASGRTTVAAPAPTNGTRRKRGQGDVVALTVRLSRGQWERMHTLAVQESVSLQELAIDAIADKFAKRGLEF
jgi:hypothetical protein